MATKANTTNSFSLNGFVATDARVCEFDSRAVARFPLALRNKEVKDGQTIRKSALISCECWRKSADTKDFDLLKKGAFVQISGFIRPDEWVKDGVKHSGIAFVVTSVEAAAKEEDPNGQEPQ